MNSSHAVQRNGISGGASTESLILADAFAEFISASSRLETFYGDLQKEVSQLGEELAERNASLHAELAKSENAVSLLRRVMEALPCAVVVLEESGHISFMNTAAGRLLCLDGGQSSARPLPGEWIKRICQSSASGLECSFVIDADGSHREISVNSRRIEQDASSAPVLMAAVLRDVSAQRAREEDCLERHKGRVMAEAAAALAEEIRSPLASIEMFTNLIAREKGDPSRWIAHLRSSTRALADAVQL